MPRTSKWRAKEDILDTELAYAAAAVDGEGCIGIHSRSQRKTRLGNSAYNLSVSVANTDARMPLWLRDVFGGNFARTCESRSNRRSCWTWTLTGKPAGEFLKKIYPYLVIKKEQTEIALQYAETINANGPLPLEIELKRVELHDKLKEIKSWRPEVIEGSKGRIING